MWQQPWIMIIQLKMISREMGTFHASSTLSSYHLKVSLRRLSLRNLIYFEAFSDVVIARGSLLSPPIHLVAFVTRRRRYQIIFISIAPHFTTINSPPNIGRLNSSAWRWDNFYLPFISISSARKTWAIIWFILTTLGRRESNRATSEHFQAIKLFTLQQPRRLEQSNWRIHYYFDTFSRGKEWGCVSTRC